MNKREIACNSRTGADNFTLVCTVCLHLLRTYSLLRGRWIRLSMLASVTWTAGRMESRSEHCLLTSWHLYDSAANVSLQLSLLVSSGQQDCLVCVSSSQSFPLLWWLNLHFLDRLFRLQPIWRLYHPTLLGHEKGLLLDIPPNVY